MAIDIGASALVKPLREKFWSAQTLVHASLVGVDNALAHFFADEEHKKKCVFCWEYRLLI